MYKQIEMPKWRHCGGGGRKINFLPIGIAKIGKTIRFDKVDIKFDLKIQRWLFIELRKINDFIE